MKHSAFVKKIVAFAAITAVLLALALPSGAFASTPKASVPLSDLVKDGKSIGFMFRNSSYFGWSGIALEVQVYAKDVAHTSDRAVQLGEQIHDFASKVSLAVDPQAYYYDDKDSAGNPVLPQGVAPSDLYRFNFAGCGETIQVSKQTYEMLVLAKQMYQKTDGAYNPASYRLVDLWGFSSRTNLGSMVRDGSLPYDRQWDDNWALPLPDQKYIDAFKQLANFDLVQFGDNGDGTYYVTKNCPDVTVEGVSYNQWIDLGGVAKGYIVDGVRQILESNGFGHYYVNCGDSSMAFTTYEDGSPLEIGLSSHLLTIWGAEPYASIKFANVSISTSGLYVRNYTYDGTTYSHIIDCNTGRPVSQDVQVITLASKLDGTTFAGEADCWTTALLVRGKDNLIAFLNNPTYTNTFEVSGLAIGKGANQVITNLTKDRFTTIFDGFVLATDVKVIDGNKVVIYNERAKDVDSTKTIVLIVLACCAAALVVLVVVKVVKKGRLTAAQRITQVRADKLFKKPDIAVYMLVALLIAVLFGTFFGAGNGDAPQVIKVKAFSGHTLFTYNVATNQYYSTPNEQYKVVATQSGNVVTVRVESNDGDDFNVIEITNDNGKVVAKVVDANCGLHKECVNYFPAITTKKGTIICNPHGLKVVADDVGNDYILI
ncbi:MAG: FAD:protein FMN transferase [Clostridia bacterium]|nr:FAD:protein FMN transferase [Clostridia bacterium]